MLSDLLMPRTDAGVAVQVVIVLVLFGVGVWRTWRIPDLRLLVIGAGVFVLGLMVLRGAH